MKLLVGTSGYAFKEWKGPFYPDDLKDDAMLGFYASKFPRRDQQHLLSLTQGERAPGLGLAGPRGVHLRDQGQPAITHHARLKPEAAELVEYLLRNTAMLGPKLGPILFQLAAA